MVALRRERAGRPEAAVKRSARRVAMPAHAARARVAHTARYAMRNQLAALP